MSRLVAPVFALSVVIAFTATAQAQHKAHSGHSSGGGAGSTAPRTHPPQHHVLPPQQPTQQFAPPKSTGSSNSLFPSLSSNTLGLKSTGSGNTLFQSMSSNTLGLSGSRLGTTRLGYGFGHGLGFVGSGAFGYGASNPSVPNAPGAPLIPPPIPNPDPPGTILVKEFPATLTVQLPPTSEMWLDGKAVTADQTDEHVFTSPDLKPGEEYTFKVKIRWMRDGKTYEANRMVTLGPGDKSRLLIASGEEVVKE
jgi:uncharacterized protein (TIGR03000 family)